MPNQDLFVKMILLAWTTQNSRTTKLFDSLTDDQLLAEVSPGRNRGIYLLGHLTAVNDGLQVLLGFGERLFPTYEDIFLENADKAVVEMPPVATLREHWRLATQKLSERFKQLTPAEWFLRHTAVSAEDFVREPHRNRLNVLITRISHEAYHHGQLVLLQKK
jgi:hypothetical protein